MCFKQQQCEQDLMQRVKISSYSWCTREGKRKKVKSKVFAFLFKQNNQRENWEQEFHCYCNAHACHTVPSCHVEQDCLINSRWRCCICIHHIVRSPPFSPYKIKTWWIIMSNWWFHPWSPIFIYLCITSLIDFHHISFILYFPFWKSKWKKKWGNQNAEWVIQHWRKIPACIQIQKNIIKNIINSASKPPPIRFQC